MQKYLRHTHTLTRVNRTMRTSPARAPAVVAEKDSSDKKGSMAVLTGITRACSGCYMWSAESNRRACCVCVCVYAWRLSVVWMTKPGGRDKQGSD